MELLLISRSRRSAEAGVFPIGRDRGCAGPRLGMSDEPIKTESNILPFGLRGPRSRLMKIPIVNRPVLRREIFGPSISISCGISLPDVLGWTRNYCEFLSALPLQRRTRSPILDAPIVWIDSMDRKKSREDALRYSWKSARMFFWLVAMGGIFYSMGPQGKRWLKALLMRESFWFRRYFFQFRFFTVRDLFYSLNVIIYAFLWVYIFVCYVYT